METSHIYQRYKQLLHRKLWYPLLKVTDSKRDVFSFINSSFRESSSKLLQALHYYLWLSLREKCPNTEFFLVRIFPHSDWIRRDTKYLSVLTPNAGKYGPEKTPHLDNFHPVCSIINKTETITKCSCCHNLFTLCVLNPLILIVIEEQ